MGEIFHILNHIRICFPWVERITSYARSSTVIKISGSELKDIGEAGLTRIHIGLESGSDKVLKINNLYFFVSTLINRLPAKIKKNLMMSIS